MNIIMAPVEILSIPLLLEREEGKGEGGEGEIMNPPKWLTRHTGVDKTYMLNRQNSNVNTTE